MLLKLALLLVVIGHIPLRAQVDPRQTGAWYMYFWSTQFQQSPWGLQGDVQYRNWNLFGDLEQLLLRGGLSYTPPSTELRLTLGYAHIVSGAFGESTETMREHRIYQEASLPQQIGKRLYLRHRYRYEQRFVQSQDFRTRYRYALFLTLPLSHKEIQKGTWYLSLYNEVFLNGQKDLGNGRTVEFFDANRFYGALGYVLTPTLKVQLGYMQQTKNNYSKGQLQFSIHSKF